jgi:lipoprotein-anchoring transpeptidase ErfK/SrfK
VVHNFKRSIISLFLAISLIASCAFILPAEISWADETPGTEPTGPAIESPTGPAIDPPVEPPADPPADVPTGPAVTPPAEPTGPAVKAPARLKVTLSGDKTKVKFSWSKVNGASGYKLWYSTNKKFKKKNKKIVLKRIEIKGKNNKTYSFDSPYNKITYYAKVRAFKTIRGKKVYSAFTETVKIKTPNRKWIQVDLSKQKTYLMKGSKKFKTYTISSGKKLTPTIQGVFKVYMKRDHHDMKGYDIVKEKDYLQPDVRWISYFYGGYAFHGTYWHHNFGHPMSHGCVNMTTADAKYVYKWAPVGTPVEVHK